MGVQAVMAPKQGDSGGGGLGSLLGILGAGIAGLATGGISLAAMGTAGGIGGAIGGGLDPASAGKAGNQGQASDDPGMRRLNSGEYQGQIKALYEGAQAAQSLPPEERAQHMDPIIQAASVLAKQNGQSGPQGQY